MREGNEWETTVGRWGELGRDGEEMGKNGWGRGDEGEGRELMVGSGEDRQLREWGEWGGRNGL